MTSFTSRYGNPARDFKGAHIWAHCRHGATVVAVSGRVDAGNVEQIIESVLRPVAAGSRLVLDLTGVTAFTPKATGLLRAVDERCRPPAWSGRWFPVSPWHVGCATTASPCR